MMLFWLSTVVLVAAGALLLALPLFKAKNFDDAARRDELNKVLYKDRLQELTLEAEEGIVANTNEVIADLKQSLLDDIPQQAHRAKTTEFKPAQVFVPSMLLFVAICYGMYASFGALPRVAEWNDSVAQLPQLTQKLMAPSDERPLTDKQMDQLVLGLRTQLHKSPQDATGWLLLGRVAMANQDSDTAAGALKKAYQLDRDNPDVRLSYAQSILTSIDDQERALARSLLTGLLQEGYVDLKIYSLLAFDAYQNGNYASAVRYWQMMQKMIGPDDSRYPMLERSISNAEQQMGKAVASVTVPVRISVAQGMQVGTQGVLIVSVHDGNGSPIPIAAARYPLGSLPRTVVLDDGNVMMEGQSLSQLETIMVRARIDADGNVASKQGDLYGESLAVKLGEPVEIVIDKQY